MYLSSTNAFRLSLKCVVSSLCQVLLMSNKYRSPVFVTIVPMTKYTTLDRSLEFVASENIVFGLVSPEHMDQWMRSRYCPLKSTLCCHIQYLFPWHLGRRLVNI